MVAFTLTSSAGGLEAQHDLPEGPPPTVGPRGAVVCHPHPTPRGTMDNKVVFKLSASLRRHGFHVVRFNFRGVGRSEGAHDEGRGELDDVRAALDHASELVQGGPLLVAGFSFGSWVGLRAAADDARVTARLAVAPPVRFYDFSAVAADPTPLAVIYAEQDELVPSEGVVEWLETCAAPPRAFPVAGAGHLFHGHLKELAVATDGWLDELGAVADQGAGRGAGKGADDASVDSPP